MPLGRWDVDGLPYPGAARFGGWLGCGIECFDAALFGIPAQEAVLMDVQHRCAERWRRGEGGGEKGGRGEGEGSDRN